MFRSIISLRTANQENWFNLFTNLLALVLPCLVFILTTVIYIPRSIYVGLREHNCAYISFLHHRAHTVSLKLIQLHPMFLIKLTSLPLHHVISLSKLMSISSLHFNCLTCSKLVTSPNSITLYTVSITSNHSHILSISPVTINLQIPSGTQLSHSAPNFVSSFHKFVLISISNNI